RAGAEPPVLRVKRAAQVGERAVEHFLPGLARCALVEPRLDDAADRAGLFSHLAAPLAPDLEHPLEHCAESGTPIPAVGWEVGAAVEDLAVGSQDGGEGPSALPGERLNGALIAGVHVGPLVPIHLDTDEV